MQSHQGIAGPCNTKICQVAKIMLPQIRIISYPIAINVLTIFCEHNAIKRGSAGQHTVSNVRVLRPRKIKCF